MKNDPTLYGPQETIEDLRRLERRLQEDIAAAEMFGFDTAELTTQLLQTTHLRVMVETLPINGYDNRVNRPTPATQQRR